MDASLERLTQALADRYAIEREIGRGGMATVHLAQDLRHNRKVAVKVMIPELAAAVGPDRFLREIEIAAKLTHPHILPVYDSGEAEGFLYFVMPFVEGESLRDRLDRERQLPIDDAIQLTREVADALAFAHELGVIHRDVKPANILLEAGHAVLADFGVAKAVVEAGEERITRTGVSLGTPAYMSPEQALGEQELDGRSDQYSLGCVLYEMLSGDAPYIASTPQAVIAKKVSDPVPSVRVVRETVPASVEAALTKALAKSPADRFRTTTEMAAALERATVPTPVAPRRLSRAVGIGSVAVAVLVAASAVAVWVTRSMTPRTDPSPLSGGILQNPEELVAVLPLENLTADTSLDYLAKLASLSISEGLESAELCRVVPFDKLSELAAGGAGGESGASDLRRTWAEETGATLAIVGHYLVMGDSLRFQLQVRDRAGERRGSVPAASGPREDPSRPLDGVRVAAVSTVASIVAPGHHLAEVTWGSYLPKLEALGLYHEGREEQARGNPDAALALYERAMEIDPGYLRPLISTLETLGNRERWQEADSVCRVAQSRMGEMARIERLITDSNCARIRHDCLAELQADRQLLEFNPMHVNDVGIDLLCLNRPREAAEYFLRWDPHASRETWEWTPNTWNYLGWAYHLLGEHEEELKVARDIRENFPDDQRGPRTEVAALAALGRTDELEPVIAGWMSLLPTGSAELYVLYSAAIELDAHGHSEAARELLERVIQWYETRGPLPDEAGPVDRRSWGLLLLFLGRLEDARPWVEGLAAEYPGNMQFQALLGVLQARLGDRAGAERISQVLADWDAPVLRGENTLYRAHIAANLGDRADAVRLLELAVAEGRPWDWWRRFDMQPLLKPLRGYPPFEDFIQPRG